MGLSQMRELKGMRIAFLAGTLGQGGAERQLFYMAKTLRESGACVRVLSLGRGEFWEKRLVEAGIPVTWVGEPRSKAGRLARIVRELRREPADVIQSQHFYTNLYSAAAARILGVIGIGAIRGGIDHEVRGAGRIYGFLCLRVPRLVAANSAAAIRSALALGIPVERLGLVRNAVDTDHFRPRPEAMSGSICLLSAGRLIGAKRFDRFLVVVASLRRAGRPVFARLVGSGPLREDLERKAADLGLTSDHLEIREAVEDLAELYREAHVFVLSSDTEGMPNVMLEAMASGLPVVAARVGGVEEVVRSEENGLLFEPEDMAGFERAVATLVERRDLRASIGAQARRDVVAAASLTRMRADLESLYSRAVA
jgi:glycosyltransferase involved in cell wall biosynthesis